MTGGGDYKSSMVLCYDESAAENPISRYQPLGGERGGGRGVTRGEERLGIQYKISPGGSEFPFNPANRFISRFQETFDRYLWCGLVCRINL